MVYALQSKLASMGTDFKEILEVRIENLKQQKARDTTPLLGAVGGSGIQTPQQIALYDDSDSYVQQRAETMQNIESTIVELGGIFQQSAHMVKEQEETVERIDTNIQDAELNIEAAHGEILKYFQTDDKNLRSTDILFHILRSFPYIITNMFATWQDFNKFRGA
ncbi:PREDICTED: syntaxin-5-like, partial [Rhagoletis zephyria]|uniref:syntaxin-5-like n=1 Tax=Rhagoletis zephyria TaxID=28612 RepID=UPI00081138D9